MSSKDELTVAAAQVASVWCDRIATTDKMLSYIADASAKGAELVAFGEAILPGYPYWIELTGGAAFNNKRQKEIHAHYMDQAVNIERGDLEPFQKLCAEKGIACYLGIIENAKDRGGHSLYCSFVYINENGTISSVHRKLMPTYEERLTWSIGDGHGLVTHPIKSFTVGGLNCWENWMPLARSALYAQGEDLHIACWPGGPENTEIITPFMALEGRSYVLSVSGVLRKSDFPKDTPYYEDIIEKAPTNLGLGGSCLAGPDGQWIIEPMNADEQIQIAEIDHAIVRQERQNFDPSGHYSRPDVFSLNVDRRRQTIATFED